MAKKKTTSKKTTTKKAVAKKEAPVESNEAEQIVERAVLESAPIITKDEPVEVKKFAKKGLTDQEVQIIKVKYSGLAELAEVKFKIYRAQTNSDREYALKLREVFGV